MPQGRRLLSSRRAFLSAAGALVACRPAPKPRDPASAPATPEDPDAAATAQATPAGAPPGISAQTLAEAEKLALVSYTAKEREQILKTLPEYLGPVLRLRQAPPPASLAPAQIFDPRPVGASFPTAERPLKRSPLTGRPAPSSEDEIAFAPLTALSEWLRTRQLKSAELAALYIKRLKRVDPTLRCVAALAEERAMEEAAAADKELAAGKWRGPLHGVPYGAKDILDTEKIPTAFGAEPYRDRLPVADAVAVKRLRDAGAVLVAKLSVGALAYGDIWYGGRTRNPFYPAEGSSGSSAGSASATAAGLVGFALGTETLGSNVSPSNRCGCVGLRPTFGRVPRGGAMPLCWSLDKIGALSRSVEDALLVLDAIRGRDPSDPSSVSVPLLFDAGASARGLKLGYIPAQYDGGGAGDVDRAALEAARRAGLTLVELSLPELPYDALLITLLVEAAAAFEELTLTNRDDELTWQAPEAWPNTFRSTRFLSAIDLVQAERLRRRVMEVMAERFQAVDAIIAPAEAGLVNLITNFTGHPALAIRAGFISSPPRDGALDGPASPTAAREVPRGLTLFGRLFDEGTLCRVGMALEAELKVQERRPAL